MICLRWISQVSPSMLYYYEKSILAKAVNDSIYFFVIKHRHLKHKGASVAELLKLVIFEHKSNTTYFLDVTIITIKATLILKHSTVLVRKDINVYEYKKLSNFTLRHKVEKDCFYCCSTFQSQYGLQSWAKLTL